MYLLNFFKIKVNPACFKCFKIINCWKHSLQIYKSNTKIITFNQLHAKSDGKDI